MKRPPLRAVLISLIALVAAGAFISVKPSALPVAISEVTESACTTVGTTLVVDFGDLNKETQVRCVKEFQGTGWDLIKAAGFEVVGTAEYPASFVCRIDEHPSVAKEYCQRTPKYSDGSWVYFKALPAQAGGTWVRSGIGAAGSSPKCGDFEGWLYISDPTAKASIPAVTPKPFRCK